MHPELHKTNARKLDDPAEVAAGSEQCVKKAHLGNNCSNQLKTHPLHGIDDVMVQIHAVFLIRVLTRIFGTWESNLLSSKPGTLTTYK